MKFTGSVHVVSGDKYSMKHEKFLEKLLFNMRFSYFRTVVKGPVMFFFKHRGGAFPD
jgi:hypothetical protein